MSGSGANARDEWGAWILHDGKGCPVRPGTIVEVVSEDGFGFTRRYVACASGGEYSSWNWKHYPTLMRVLRYRVKKPDGMKILEASLSVGSPSRVNDPVASATRPVRSHRPDRAGGTDDPEA